jgi:CheY-like chemotaxis protein
MVLWGRRIMVVDDDADTLDIVTEVLQRVGAEVIAVGAPQYALPTVVFLMPDALIVDVAMPGQDGVGLVRGLRLLPADQGGRIPALTLTATPASERARAEWLAAGFQSHLTKPFDPEELVKRLDELVGQTVERRRRDLPVDQWPADARVERRARYQRGRDDKSDSASSDGKGRAK